MGSVSAAAIALVVAMTAFAVAGALMVMTIDGTHCWLRFKRHAWTLWFAAEPQERHCARCGRKQA